MQRGRCAGRKDPQDLVPGLERQEEEAREIQGTPGL